MEGVNLVYGTYRIPRNLEEFNEIIKACANRGITWIDTAPIYNQGISESWLRTVKGFKIATKAGKFFKNGKLEVSLDPSDLQRSIDSSISRLGTSKIDLLFLHNYDPKFNKERIAETIINLIQKNPIERFGVSNFPLKTWEFLAEQKLIQYIQLPFISDDLNMQIEKARSKGLEVWIYRVLKQNSDNSAGDYKERLTATCKNYSQCRIVFGASRLQQVISLFSL